MSSMLLKGFIRNGRVETVSPIDLPEGTEVMVTSGPCTMDSDPMSPEEIASVHAAMHKLLPLDIPDDAAADLDAWEQRLNQHGIDNFEKDIGDVFR